MPRSSPTSGIRAPRRTLAFLGIVLIGANLRAPITSLGPVLPDIQATLHLSGAGAGLLNALPLIIFALLSLFAPQVGRQHGLKRVLGLALAAILAGTLLRSLVLPGAVWIGTAVLSAGIAFGNVLLPGLVKLEFPDKAAGLIASYAAAMAGMAGVAAGLAVPIARMPGLDWRWSIGAWAAVALVALAMWAPQVKQSQHRLAPADAVPCSLSPWRHAI